MNTTEKQQEALSRAQGGQTVSNYATIYRGFLAIGIQENEIHPRENVFTFQAWRALGRTVRKGEHGVKVNTFIEHGVTEKDPDTGEEKTRAVRRPWTTTVFHISQTIPLNGN